MSNLKGQLVLVTGATGFVGSHLTRALIAEGAKVRILVRETSDKVLVDEFKKSGTEVCYGDVTDKESVLKASVGCFRVFHIAALYREAKFSDSVYFNVNLEGTRHVLDACVENKVARLIYCSTIGVHSHIENPPANESEPYHPTDIYQESKCEAEKLVNAYFAKGLLETVIIRPAMIWGEGDRRILKLFKGIVARKLPIIGSGKGLTHWVYVQDLVRGFILAAQKDQAAGQTYILAGRESRPLEEVYRLIAKKAGVKLFPFKIPALPIQILGAIVEFACMPFGIEPPLHRRRVDFFIKNRSFDISKAKRELDYKPANSLEEEVEIIYNWYQQKGWL